jgi:hypothetical protein
MAPENPADDWFPTGEDGMKLVVHTAATGDEGFEWRRKNVAEPLLKHKIASLIVEIPYYGKRKPPEQKKVFFSEVKDLGLMAFATIEEMRAILHWIRKSTPFQGLLGVAGQAPLTEKSFHQCTRLLGKFSKTHACCFFSFLLLLLFLRNFNGRVHGSLYEFNIEPRFGCRFHDRFPLSCSHFYWYFSIQYLSPCSFLTNGSLLPSTQKEQCLKTCALKPLQSIQSALPKRHDRCFEIG